MPAVAEAMGQDLIPVFLCHWRGHDYLGHYCYLAGFALVGTWTQERELGIVLS